MTTAIRRRRGTTAQHSTFIGLEGETTIDTDKEVVVVHDGTTQGGFPLMRENGSNSALALGSAGTPSLKFTGDTNTGIYSPGADQVAISTNGTGRLFVDASGQIGLGLTPGAWGASGRAIETSGGALYGYSTDQIFLVQNAVFGGASWTYKNNGAATNYRQISGEHIWSGAASGTAGNAATFSERMRLDSSGRLGLGTSSPATKLEVEEGTIQVKNTSTATLGALLNHGIAFRGANQVGQDRGTIAELRPYLGTAADNDFGLQFRTQTATGSGVTTKMTLTPGGSLGIGSTLAGNANNRLLVRSDSASAISNVLLLSNGPVDNNAGQGVRINLSGVSEANSNIRYAYIEAANQTSGNDHYLAFGTNSAAATPTERARIDSSGRLLVGTSTSRSVNIPYGSSGQFTSTDPYLFQVESAGFAGASFITNRSADAGGSYLVLGRSRGSSPGGTTIVANGDNLGTVCFNGSDGATLLTGAAIRCDVDGTPGTNDLPSRLVFSTTADGASSPTERMRITNDGTVVIGDTTTTTTSGTGQKFYNTTPSIPNFLTVSDDNIPAGRIIEHYNANASYNGVRFYVRLDGGIGNFQANNVNLSDVNSKKDITPAGGTWDCLKEWEIVNYRYNDQPDNSDLNMGVIAQQVAESCPEVITVFQEATEDEPEKLGVKEQQMMWMAIKALQEAQLRIETLEAEVAALKGA
jgi:hypothetical protein